MKADSTLEMIRSGEVTIAELRGITDGELKAAISAGRKLIDSGCSQAAAEVLAGLALYDPFRPEVWSALEELFRRECCPEQANLFADIARVMAAQESVMEQIKAVGCREVKSTELIAESEALASLATKVLAGGGLAADCKILLSEDNAFRVGTRIEGIQIKERVIKQLRRRRMALLRKRMRAMKKARSLSTFGKTFSGIMNAVASVVCVFCPPAGALMKVGGAITSSQCTIAAASCSEIAERSVADALRANHRREAAEEISAELVESLRNVVESESRMSGRISSLVESEQHGVILR